jgi:hypothetical protein
MTRVLNSNGALRVLTSDTVIVDGSDRTAFGELSVAQPTPICGWMFSNNVHPAMIVNTQEGGAPAITIDAGRASILASNSSGSSTNRLWTRKSLAYVPGIGGLARFTSVFENPMADSYMLVGLGNDSDGFFFGYNGTSFGVCRLRDGTQYWTEQANWNGEALGFTINPALLIPYQIRFQWLGGGAISFYVEDPDTGALKRVHTVPYANTSEFTSVNNPKLPMFVKVHKETTAGVGQPGVLTPSGMALIEGDRAKAMMVDNAVRAARSISANAEGTIITIQNKASVFGGSNNNRSTVRVRLISAAAEGTRPCTFRVYTNSTISGAAYADVNTNNSIVESDTSGSAASGRLIAAFEVGRTGNQTIGADSFTHELNVGETLSVTALSALASDVTCSVAWEEEM